LQEKSYWRTRIMEKFKRMDQRKRRRAIQLIKIQVDV
jgi:hypothetical protein